MTPSKKIKAFVKTGGTFGLDDDEVMALQAGTGRFDPGRAMEKYLQDIEFDYRFKPYVQPTPSEAEAARIAANEEEVARELGSITTDAAAKTPEEQRRAVAQAGTRTADVNAIGLGLKNSPYEMARRDVAAQEAGQGDPYAAFRDNPPESWEALLGGLPPYREKIIKWADSGFKGEHPLIGLQGMKGSIDKAKEAMRADVGRANVGPLLQALDAMSGTKFSEKYQAPMTAKDAALGEVALDQKMVEQLGELAKREGELLGKKSESKYWGSLIRAETAKEGMDFQAVKDIMKTYRPVARAISEDMSQIDSTEGILGRKDSAGRPLVTYAEANQALSNISRILGEKGVLTDRDVIRVWPRTIKRDAAALISYFKPSDAYLPPSDVEQMLQVLAAVRKAKFKNSAKDWLLMAKGYAAAPGRFSQFFREGGLGDKLTGNLYAAGQKATGVPASQLAEEIGRDFASQPASTLKAETPKTTKNPTALNKYKKKPGAK
jgi:hypothetical protein